MNVDVRFTRDVLYETSAGLFGGFGLIVQFLRSFSALIVKQTNLNLNNYMYDDYDLILNRGMFIPNRYSS